MKHAAWNTARRIDERIIVEGDLLLLTPTHFGGGDWSEQVDMPLSLDAAEGRARLAGSSLAGALRDYLRCRTGSDDPGNRLFGWHSGQDGEQSPLIVCDALGPIPGVEVRDGVAIDGRTRTAMKGLKFDLELIEAGAGFPLRLELLVSSDERDALCTALAIALQGLERAEIGLGARKRRGFGRCQVTGWQVRRYDLTTPAGLISWVANDEVARQSGPKIAPLLLDGQGAAAVDRQDSRTRFLLTAEFSVDGSLLIRSGFGRPKSADTVHLHSARPGGEDKSALVPVVSGTSLAGALRARALRIAHTLELPDPQDWVDALFGPRRYREDEQPFVAKTPEQTEGDKRPFAGRVWVAESVISGDEPELELIQNRVKIDRFTGGAYETALFNAQPYFPTPGARLKLELRIDEPSEAEIGLLLLLLKDLWTGDLPLGGESSVGRGRLVGHSAQLELHRPGRPHQTWELRSAGKDGLSLPENWQELNPFIDSLQRRQR